MQIIKNHVVPTGNILIVAGERGRLECLSIGDYGKEKNIKADFMGLSKEIDGVPHGDIMPLSKKWVITISSQYGCSMACQFCDVPKVGPGINATHNDLIGQVEAAISLHPEIIHAERVNIHFARMGEPLFNPNVLTSAVWLAGYFASKGWGYHPVVSTMMPRKVGYNNAYKYLARWCEIKNDILGGNAGLQLSVNTSDDHHHERLFGGEAMSLGELSSIVRQLPPPKGRKYTINFALTDAPIDGEVLIKYFNPAHWLCKITPMHQTAACREKKLTTKDGYEHYYPYRDVEKNLRESGYDVIVFIPSKEEDESRITCGNAILSHRGDA